MKCLICSTEIDDKKEFSVAVGPQGQMIEDVLGKFNHVKELNRWTHVTLTAQKAAGSVVILSGHVCPVHNVVEGSLALAVAPNPVLRNDTINANSDSPVSSKKTK